MKRRTIIILVVLILETQSFSKADAMYGEYLLKGYIEVQNEPLKNDSVKLVYYHFDRKISKDDITMIYTDKDGYYEKKINWMVPCLSSPRPKQCKEGFTKEQCDSVKICLDNPDSLGFIYGKKQIKVKNQFYKMIKQQSGSKEVVQSIIFI